ncbi:MAG: hypothetical protein ACI4RU_00880 [Acutalibacteraceae bacterium]
MNELISRKEALRAIENIVAVGTFVEGMKEKCLRAVKDVPVIDSDYTDRGITLYFDENGTANVLNEDYVIYCANEETLEMVKEALKKQIPKEPLNPCDRYYGAEKGGTCPCCGAHTNSATYNYCRKCGQALDWSDIV